MIRRSLLILAFLAGTCGYAGLLQVRMLSALGPATTVTSGGSPVLVGDDPEPFPTRR